MAPLTPSMSLLQEEALGDARLVPALDEALAAPLPRRSHQHAPRDVPAAVSTLSGRARGRGGALAPRST